MSSAFFYDPLHEFDHLFNGAFDASFNPSGVILERRGSATGDVARTSKSFKPRHVATSVHTFHYHNLRRMDLHENIEANTITATFELAGLSKENVDITVHDGRLHVTGESKISSVNDQEEGGYAVTERRYGKFSRTLQLPYGVKVSKWIVRHSQDGYLRLEQEDQVNAKLENGILTVTFPRSTPENEMAPKKIAIA